MPLRGATAAFLATTARAGAAARAAAAAAAAEPFWPILRAGAAVGARGSVDPFQRARGATCGLRTGRRGRRWSARGGAPGALAQSSLDDDSLATEAGAADDDMDRDAAREPETARRMRELIDAEAEVTVGGQSVRKRVRKYGVQSTSKLNSALVSGRFVQ